MAHQQEVPPQHPRRQGEAQRERSPKKDEFGRTQKAPQTGANRRNRGPIPYENPRAQEAVLQNRHQNCQETYGEGEKTFE